MNDSHNLCAGYLSGLPTYQGTMAVYDYFSGLTGNPALASLAEKVAVEMADKTISLLLAAVGLIFIHDILTFNKKDTSGSVLETPDPQ